MSTGFQIHPFLPVITGRKTSLFAADLDRHQQVLHGQVKGMSALVVGGAGTIGAAFVKALLQYGPRKVVVIDANENGLAEQIRDLRSTHGITIPNDFVTYPISYADPVARKIIDHHGPFDIVANFAAHKHVRSEKDIFSVQAMLENNVLRANEFMVNIASHNPSHLFAVSTDKAANPVNIMGASKKLMEDMLIAHAQKMPVTTARFANVAFSNGSLLQAFLERLSKGQPLSAPNDVRRYFVTPEESGQICMLACLLGQPGNIFFPILDEASHAKRFSDIAVLLLEQLGLTARICESEEEARERAACRKPADTDYPVYFFGSDTTGEKMIEEFYAAGEDLDLTRFEKLGIVRAEPGRDGAGIGGFLERLEALFRAENLEKTELVRVITDYLGSFDHSETGKSLDSRM